MDKIESTAWFVSSLSLLILIYLYGTDFKELIKGIFQWMFMSSTFIIIFERISKNISKPKNAESKNS